MKIIECEQGTELWFKARQLKMTASHAQAIASQGKGLETYITELLAEYFSNAEKEHYSNEHTERGNELEPQARTVYELENDCFVEEVGFVEYNQYAGVSPDGLVGKDGLLEIKCPSDKVYMQQLLNNRVPSAYEWQMQYQMLATGREWCDYFVYNPNFKQSFIKIRVHKDEEKQAKLIKGLEVGQKKIEKALKVLDLSTDK